MLFFLQCANTPDPTSPNNESIYTILIKLPETQKSSNSEKSNSNSNSAGTTKSKSRTSIQQLLSEPDPALIKTMKRCDSEHIRSASNNIVSNARGRNGRNHPGNNSNNTASRTVPTTPGESIILYHSVGASAEICSNSK